MHSRRVLIPDDDALIALHSQADLAILDLTGDEVAQLEDWLHYTGCMTLSQSCTIQIPGMNQYLPHPNWTARIQKLIVNVAQFCYFKQRQITANIR